MWPILPALFLLILQGPSDLERMGSSGRLPAALEALHRHLETPAAQKLAHDEKARELLFASLLALSGEDLGKALAQFLALDFGDTDVAESRSMWAFHARHGQKHAYIEPAVNPAYGFLISGRTRDGPAVR